MRIGLAVVAHDDGLCVDTVALHEGGDTVVLDGEGRYPIVTHERISQRHQLPRVAWIRQTLWVAHHRRVEYHFSGDRLLKAKALSLEFCSVLQDECHIFHLLLFISFYVYIQKEGRNVNKTNRPCLYSTVTDFAKFLG